MFSLGWSLEVFFFFKQKTAYEMRISDWSSDVCSSDLDHLGRCPLVFCRDGADHRILQQLALAERAPRFGGDLAGGTGLAQGLLLKARVQLDQIGRASCRERVCQYV